MSTSARVSKAYRKLKKCFQHLKREHEDIKNTYQAHLVDFVLETNSPCNVKGTSVCEEVKALFNKRYPVDEKFLLKDFQGLEKRVKSLTITLKDLEEKHKEMLKQKLLKKNAILLIMSLIS